MASNEGISLGDLVGRIKQALDTIRDLDHDLGPLGYSVSCTVTLASKASDSEVAISSGGGSES